MTSSGIQPADLGFFSTLAAQRQPERRGARAGHHHARGQQAAGADGGALGVVLVNRTTRRMSLTPEGEAVPGACAPHPRRDRRLEQLLGSVQGTPKGCCA
jgi:LysR family transcriptional activator of dmlA